MDWIRCQRVAERMQKNAPWYTVYADEHAYMMQGRGCLINILNQLLPYFGLALDAVEVFDDEMRGELPVLYTSINAARRRIERCGAKVTDVHKAGPGVYGPEGVAHVHFEGLGKDVRACLIRDLLKEP